MGHLTPCPPQKARRTSPEEWSTPGLWSVCLGMLMRGLFSFTCLQYLPPIEGTSLVAWDPTRFYRHPCRHGLNKKVLLRERKRHTDRGVSSTTRSGVTPPARFDRGGGYLRWGTSQPGPTGGGYPRWGTPLAGPGWGTPPPPAPGRGTPPPPAPGRDTPPSVNRQTDTCQNITFPSYYVRGR